MRGRTLVVCRRAFTDHRQGDVKPLGVVVLYTDLLFQLPPTLTPSLPRSRRSVVDMRYVAMRRKTT